MVDLAYVFVAIGDSESFEIKNAAIAIGLDVIDVEETLPLTCLSLILKEA